MDLRNPHLVLAATGWGEARSDGKEGMAAVMSVVLNRLAHPVFRWAGHLDICSICLAPHQFQCWQNQRSRLLALTGTDLSFVAALILAQKAIDGRLIDHTNGAIAYHATSSSPAWAYRHRPSARIGHHLFYTLTELLDGHRKAPKASPQARMDS